MKKRFLKWLILGGAGGLIMLFLFFGWQFYVSLKPIYQEAQGAGNLFFQAVAEVKENNFVQAAIHFDNTSSVFASADAQLDELNFFRRLPKIRTEIQSVRQILSVGVILSKTANRLSIFGSELAQPFKSKPGLKWEEITTETRLGLLKKIYQSPPLLYGAKAEAELSLNTLRSLPKSVVTFFLKDEIAEMKDKLEFAVQYLDDAISLLEILPHLTGFPAPKTYLVLLENNTELRPGGGFIGTYGILKIKEGRIVELFTDDSYNLDRRVKPEKMPLAPEILKKYLGVERLYLRDSNWSPDFRESAAAALFSFKTESGWTGEIDGVIAITPDFISSLLKIVGPLGLEGQLFTSDDFIDALEWQVEIGYLKAGIPKPQRKAVIGLLAKQLIGEIDKLPLEKWPQIIHLIRTNLDEKQILLYSNDADLRQFIDQQGWSGRLQQNVGDYLMVVDANLGSLKSDPAVERKINYGVNQVGDDLVATLDILYEHHGGFDWKTTRYKTYTRVYVPLGSEMISSQGVMIAPKDQRPGPVAISQELGKTVFGAFISIEPGESRALEFKYKLPAPVKDLVDKQSYQLLVQKQPGVAERDLTIGLNLGKKIKSWSPADKVEWADNNAIIWQTKLRRDQIFEVRF